MDFLRVVAYGLGALVVFVLFWSFVVWFIAQISGWRQLAEAYPARRPFNEQCWSWQSGRLRWASGYNGILVVCADRQALHLRTLIFFRPGNPPMSIPWEEIDGRKRGFMVELRFQRAESIPLRIMPGLADRLVTASGGLWQYEKG